MMSMAAPRCANGCATLRERRATFGHRQYLLLADYQSDVNCQKYLPPTETKKKWTRMSILNTARMGKIKGDRTILEYCRYLCQSSCPRGHGCAGGAALMAAPRCAIGILSSTGCGGDIFSRYLARAANQD
ncbi:MAG: glycogen/starch/alpha-glucan phosphorylase [Hormoscilla sp. GM7CHS1pb]|nr:glycogen/starch/alpha-glucan phosphorylase [Hormoscilla sp. GM7CHS1pb]